MPPGEPAISTDGVRIAVVGAGLWGAKIVRDLVGLGVAVSAIDTDLDARARARQLGAVDVGDTPDLGRVDGIVVATPASTHHRLLLDLADFPGPLACEKPLTTSVDEAREVVEAVGDRLTVLHVWRYHPGVQCLGELARTGAVGAPTALRTIRVNWTSPRRDVDPVWTLLPHDLSITAEVLGEIPPLRWATTETIDGRVVGCLASYGDGSGPHLLAEVSTRSRQKVRTVVLHGTDGVAELPSGDAPAVIVSTGRGAQPNVETIPVSAEPALVRELRSFVEHVAGGVRPKTDAAEGLAVVEGVAAALGAT